MEVHALASGSSGNSMLVKSEGVNLLIDAGLGIRKLSNLLHARGIAADGLTAILVTHEHIDHIGGLAPAARRYAVPVVANRKTLQACTEASPYSFESCELESGDELVFGSIRVTSFAVPHDAVSPVGYSLQCGADKVTYFTDAGSVTAAMREALTGANLAIVEANHDVEWLLRGPYTMEMKRRVRSSTGHLSNVECADMLSARLEDGGPMAIWLAHLSKVNNSPSLARRTVESTIRARTRTPFTLDVALRDSPSSQWRSGLRSASQLALF